MAAKPRTLPDDTFDRYSRLVRSLLGVPVGLVTIVEEDRQAFLSAEGLPQPWQTQMETPLSHSFCQYVVKDEQALIVEDARDDVRLATNLAISELGVIAYAGFPITDSNDETVGSLCAIDSVPRKWTESDLAILEDLAASCSAELRAKELTQRSAEAEAEALANARQAYFLLTLSEALSDTATAADVLDALQLLTSSDIGCAHIGLWSLDDEEELSFVAMTRWDWPIAHSAAAPPERDLLSIAARSEDAMIFQSRDERRAYEATSNALDMLDYDHGGARVYLPLVIRDQRIGCLVLDWDEAREFDSTARTTFLAVAIYVAQAIERARLLDERSTVGRMLQRALLPTKLASVDGVALTTRYIPADTAMVVGGDWFDAFAVRQGTVIAVGDIAGHDIPAAAAMGQIRTMVRMATSSHDDPAVALAQVNEVQLRTALPLLSSAFVGILQQADGVLSMKFASAGHPPPVLVRPNGNVEFLVVENGPFLGVVDSPELYAAAQVELEPGCALLVYTDGLIERRGGDIRDDLERLRTALERLFASGRPRGTHLLDAVLASVLGDEGSDDIAMLLLEA